LIVQPELGLERRADAVSETRRRDGSGSDGGDVE
jgi:hypothetical protein